MAPRTHCKFAFTFWITIRLEKEPGTLIKHALSNTHYAILSFSSEEHMDNIYDHHRKELIAVLEDYLVDFLYNNMEFVDVSSKIVRGVELEKISMEEWCEAEEDREETEKSTFWVVSLDE